MRGWLSTATAFNYAICSPAIYLLTFGQYFVNQPIKEAFSWFGIVFLAPTALALCHAGMIQADKLGSFYRLLGLRPISPIPTGWDWIFSTTEPCFVLITLKDGTEIAGYFGKRSMASSDPDHKDIYVERVYTIAEEGQPWEPVERSLGMQIDGTNIAYIEFRS